MTQEKDFAIVSQEEVEQLAQRQQKAQELISMIEKLGLDMKQAAELMKHVHAAILSPDEEDDE